MNLWFRVLRVMLLAWWRRPLGLDDESVLHFRVWPTDLDINIHMTNSRYQALMDLGRLDLILRSGMGRLMWRGKWQAVIAGALVRYRRPLRPFQRFTLRSRVIGWDQKWLFIEHRIEAGGVVACHAMVKGMLLDQTGGIPSAVLASRLGWPDCSQPLPGWIAAWLSAEAAMGQPALSRVEEQCVL